jgi:hypothetical protein
LFHKVRPNMFKIAAIITDKNNRSIFTEVAYKKNQKGGMLLSDQIVSKNFRLRESQVGYSTDWHLSGDPTLIIIQKGILRIILQNEEYLDFKCGQMFIAADNLTEDIGFDKTIHGHKAVVIGNEILLATHIKLDNWIIP